MGAEGELQQVADMKASPPESVRLQPPGVQQGWCPCAGGMEIGDARLSSCLVSGAGRSRPGLKASLPLSCISPNRPAGIALAACWSSASPAAASAQ
jgi:hypothetical protein